MKTTKEFENIIKVLRFDVDGIDSWSKSCCFHPKQSPLYSANPMRHVSGRHVTVVLTPCDADEAGVFSRRIISL